MIENIQEGLNVVLTLLINLKCNNEFIDELKEKGEPVTMVSAYKGVFDKGRNEGISIGEARGRNEGRRETAFRMLAGGKLSIQDIAEYSNLSVEEVRKLSEQK